MLSEGKQSDWSLRAFFSPNWEKKILSYQREDVFIECLKYCDCSFDLDEILSLAIKIPQRFRNKEETPHFLLEAEKRELTWSQAVLARWKHADTLRNEKSCSVRPHKVGGKGYMENRSKASASISGKVLLAGGHWNACSVYRTQSSHYLLIMLLLRSPAPGTPILPLVLLQPLVARNLVPPSPLQPTSLLWPSRSN